MAKAVRNKKVGWVAERKRRASLAGKVEERSISLNLSTP